MKKIVLVSVLFCFFININAQSNFRPSLVEVVDKFDNTYAFDSKSTYLRLSKNPLGWSVYEIEFKNNKWTKVNEQLFWSKAQNQYLPLKFNPSDNEETPLRNIARSDVYRFERNYYYGYNEADKDVIDELANKKNLNDTALDGLARAYSSYAMSFVENVYTNYDKNNQLSDTGFIPENLTDSFIKYVDKGIETFKKLTKVNPHYETIVGSAYIKYCNEYMYAYLCLQEWGYPMKANKYLLPNLYSEAFLSAAKNFLSSVEDNSIIFSNGDNDTYPVLYLQLTQNYKPNVNVLNLSILSKPRYIKMIRNGYAGFRPVPMAIIQEAYNSSATELSFVSQKGNTDYNITTAKQLINFFNTNYYRNSTFNYLKLGIEERVITMDVNVAACIANNQLNAEEETPETIEIQFQHHLYKNALAALDIISTNNWTNTVYIATGYDGLKIKKHLLRTGVLHIISPKSTSVTYEAELENDKPRLYTNLMKNFSFTESTNFIDVKGRGFKPIIYNLRKAYSDYLKNCDAENVDEIAEKALNLIPNSFIPYGEELIVLANCWVVTNPTKAEQLLITIAYNKYTEYANPKPYLNFYYSNEAEKQTLENILDVLKSIANTYRLNNLQTTLEEINKKLNP